MSASACSVVNGHGKRDNTAQTPGFDFDTAGLTAGIDYRYSDTFVFGLALGYNRNNTDITRDRGGAKKPRCLPVFRKLTTRAVNKRSLIRA